MMIKNVKKSPLMLLRVPSPQSALILCRMDSSRGHRHCRVSNVSLCIVGIGVVVPQSPRPDTFMAWVRDPMVLKQSAII